MKRAKLAVFWGDTRTLLSMSEKKEALATATLESISNDEILLRDVKSGRLIVITDKNQKNLFCALCKSELVHERYGQTCPDFAECALAGEHRARKNGE